MCSGQRWWQRDCTTYRLLQLQPPLVTKLETTTAKFSTKTAKYSDKDATQAVFASSSACFLNFAWNCCWLENGIRPGTKPISPIAGAYPQLGRKRRAFQRIFYEDRWSPRLLQGCLSTSSRRPPPGARQPRPQTIILSRPPPVPPTHQPALPPAQPVQPRPTGDFFVDTILVTQALKKGSSGSESDLTVAPAFNF